MKRIFLQENLLIQRQQRCTVGTVYVLHIGFGRSPTSIFEVGFEKSDFKKLRVGTNLPCLLRLQMQKLPEQKNNRPLQVELENGRS